MLKVMGMVATLVLFWTTGLFGQIEQTNRQDVTDSSADTVISDQDNGTNAENTGPVYPEVFGLYTEIQPMVVEWETNVTKEIWRGMTLTEERKWPDEGGYFWKFKSTGQTWLGMGIKPLPAKTMVDMSAYSNGSLNFSFKGSNDFKVGIKSGTNDDQWISSSHLWGFGFTNDNEWRQIKIPISFFSNVSLTNISYYFMFSADSSRGLLPGTIYSIDNIYWQKSYEGPRTNYYIDTNFGIFSDSVESGLEWDKNSKLDIFFNNHGGLKIVDLVKGAGKGLNAWKIIGLGRWGGFGIRPNPPRTYKDMGAYSNGSLHFMYRGFNNFKVGIKSGSSSEFWLSTTNMSKYGFVTNNTNENEWHEVIIPFSLCTNIDFKRISEYFLFTTEDIDYKKGESYYLDEIYWSIIDPYAKAKPAPVKKNIKKKKTK